MHFLNCLCRQAGSGIGHCGRMAVSSPFILFSSACTTVPQMHRETRQDGDDHCAPGLAQVCSRTASCALTAVAGGGGGRGGSEITVTWRSALVTQRKHSKNLWSPPRRMLDTHLATSVEKKSDLQRLTHSDHQLRIFTSHSSPKSISVMSGLC